MLVRRKVQIFLDPLSISLMIMDRGYLQDHLNKIMYMSINKLENERLDIEEILSRFSGNSIVVSSILEKLSQLIEVRKKNNVFENEKEILRIKGEIDSQLVELFDFYGIQKENSMDKDSMLST